MADDRKMTTLGDLIGWRKEGSVGSPRATGTPEPDPAEMVREPVGEIVKVEPGKSTDIPVLLGVLKKLNSDLAEGKKKDDPSIGEAFSALARAFSDYQKVPETEKQLISSELSQAFGPGLRALGIQSKLDEIVTVGSVIVVYRPKLLNMKAEQREKIRNVFTAVLTANPDADLKDLKAVEASIGVTILNVQRPAPPPPQPDTGKYSDW